MAIFHDTTSVTISLFCRQETLIQKDDNFSLGGGKNLKISDLNLDCCHFFDLLQNETKSQIGFL